MAAPLQRGLAAQLLDVLRERILTGDLPPGTRLNEVQIAREFDTSRAPLREAIRALTSEGLLTYRPNHGTVVFEADTAGVTALFELRTALESSGARLAANRRTPDQVKQLQAACDQNRDALTSGRRFPYRLDLDFHRTLMQAALSPRIADQVWLVQQQVIILRSQLTSDPVHAHASLQDHEAITTAVAAGNGDQAANLMTTHLDRVCQQMLSAHAAQPR